MSSVRTFFIQFGHFLTGNALLQLLSLITFPILTRILSVEQYGILGLVNATMLLVVAVAKLGLSDGIIRFYPEYSRTPEMRILFSSTVMTGGISLSLGASFIYLLGFFAIAPHLTIEKQFVYCFIVMGFHLLIRPVNIIVLNFLRAEGKTLFINAINFFGKLFSVILSLLLLVFVFQKLYGFFIGIVLAETVVAALLLRWFFAEYNIVFNKISFGLVKKIILFGLPLLFNELSYLVLSYADRFLIITFLDAEALGVYSVGYNLAMYVANMITFSLSYAVVPNYVKIFEQEGKKATEEFLKKCMHYLLIGVIPICVGYYAVSGDLIVTFASHKYASAAIFSPIILLGTLLLGLNNVLNAGLYINKKSVAILSIMLSAVFINIILNVLLIPRYGVNGAAIATLLSCLAASLLTVYYSFKHLIVRIDFKYICYYLILSGVMFYVVGRIETSEAWINLVSKILVGVIIIVPGVLLRERELLRKIRIAFQ